MAHKGRLASFLPFRFVWLGLVAGLLAASAHARTWQISVVAADTGQTLSNATVTASWSSNGTASARFVDSRFEVAVPEDAVELRITAKHPGHAPLQTAISPNNPSPRLALPLARTFSGTVIDESNRPIPGVQVFLNFPRRITGPRIPVDDLPVVTDAQGRWSADWVPTEVSRLRLQFRHADFETEDLSDHPMAALADGSARSQLRPLLRIEGVVLDPAGQPLADTDVFYGDEYMLWGIEENRKTKTDAAGKFSFPGLVAKKWAIGVFSPRFAPSARVVELKPGLQPLTFKLVPGRTVSARVVDAKGQPLSGVKVRWDEAGDLMRYPGWNGETDAEGRFQITNSPAADISVDLSKEGFMHLRVRLEKGSKEIEISLPPVLVFKGTVQDEDGKPIPSFTIIPGMFLGGTLGDSEGFTAPDYGTKTFSDGRFVFELTSPVIGRMPPPFRHGLQFEAAGYQTQVVGPLESDAERLAIVLKPLAETVSRILTSEGAPAVGAEIRLAREPFALRAENARFKPLRRHEAQGVSTVVADAHGEAKLGRSAYARYGLVLHESGFAYVDTTNTFPGDIQLIPWASLSGTLRYQGEPMRRQPIVLLLDHQKLQRGTNVGWYPNPLSGYVASTDDEGRFSLDRVPAGIVRLCTFDPVDPPPGVGVLVGVPQHHAVVHVFRVDPGSSSNKAIDVPGMDVTGRIVLPYDAPSDYDWRYASLWLSRQFSVPMIPPAELDATGRRRWLEGWFFSDEASVMRPWVSLQRSLHRDGEILPIGRSVPIQADGGFRFRGLEPGLYRGRIVLDVPVEALKSSESGRFSSPETLESLPFQLTVPTTADRVWHLGDIGWTNAASSSVPEPDARQPVTVGLSFANPPQPGTVVMAKIHVRVAAGHYLYGPDEPAKTYHPLALELKLPDGWQPMSDWRFPASIEKDGHKTLRGDFAVRRSFLVPPNAKGDFTVRCEIRSQACNDELCWPPKTLTAEASFQLPAPTPAKP